MHKIVNRTNSPFDLQAVSGKVRLAAFGEIEADFEPEYLAMLRRARTVEVIDHPLDGDRDGNLGGSLPARERGVDPSLIAEAKRLGVKVDRRFGENRIRELIRAANDRMR